MRPQQFNRNPSGKIAIFTYAAILALAIAAIVAMVTFAISNPMPDKIPSQSLPGDVPAAQQEDAPASTPDTGAANPKPTELWDPFPTDRAAVVKAYASCRGRYAGDQYQERYDETERSISLSISSISEIRAITFQECPPAFARSNGPTPTPDTSNDNPATTPRWLFSPGEQANAQRTPTNSPTPPATQSEPQPTTAKLRPTENRPDHRREMDGLLANIAGETENETDWQLQSMPFLDSLDGYDVNALKSILLMVQSRPDLLERTLKHPSIEHAITDQWTPVISVMGNPHLSDDQAVNLLDPGRTTVQRATVHSTLSGEIQLAVVRNQPPGLSNAADLLGAAILNVEAFAVVPFPEQSAVLFFNEQMPPELAATNHDSHISVQAKYDAPSSDAYGAQLHHIIAHEVSHYYWRSNADWIDEGMAELTATVSRHMTDGSLIEAANPPCYEAGTVRDIESLGHHAAEQAYRCNYSVGERFFLSLLRAVGDVDFRQAMRSLHLRSPAASPDQPPLDIHSIEQQFANDPSSREPAGPLASRRRTSRYVAHRLFCVGRQAAGNQRRRDPGPRHRRSFRPAGRQDHI